MTATSRLARLARPRPVPVPDDGPERCELCGEAIPADHRHLVDVGSRDLLCGCRACTILFDSPAASNGRYRVVPDRRLRIEDFALEDDAWTALRIPVEMAFFFHATPTGRVVAFYPSPAGATESLLELEAWRSLAAANPVLEGLDPDVEALLVHRARGAREHWIVPIDDCYALVGLMRTRWRGLSGGAELWAEIEAFFEDLGRRGRLAGRDGTVKRRVAAVAVAGAGEAG